MLHTNAWTGSQHGSVLTTSKYFPNPTTLGSHPNHAFLRSQLTHSQSVSHLAPLANLLKGCIELGAKIVGFVFIFPSGFAIVGSSSPGDRGHVWPI
jgi:hypothetical protein